MHSDQMSLPSHWRADWVLILFVPQGLFGNGFGGGSAWGATGIYKGISKNLWMYFKTTHSRSPGRIALLIGVSSYIPKGCGFNSQSGHVPRSLVRSLVEARVGSSQSMFLPHISVFLSLFLPLSLKSINISSGEDFKTHTHNRSVVFPVSRSPLAGRRSWSPGALLGWPLWRRSIS